MKYVVECPTCLREEDVVDGCYTMTGYTPTSPTPHGTVFLRLGCGCQFGGDVGLAGTDEGRAASVLLSRIRPKLEVQA